MICPQDTLTILESSYVFSSVASQLSVSILRRNSLAKTVFRNSILSMKYSAKKSLCVHRVVLSPCQIMSRSKWGKLEEIPLLIVRQRNIKEGRSHSGYGVTDPYTWRLSYLAFKVLYRARVWEGALRLFVFLPMSNYLFGTERLTLVTRG